MHENVKVYVLTHAMLLGLVHMATVEFVFGVETRSRLVIQLSALNFLGVKGIITQDVGIKLTVRKFYYQLQNMHDHIRKLKV